MKNLPYTQKSIILIVLLILQAFWIKAQSNIAWPKDPVMTNAMVTSTGELKITPSSTSSANDFDFLTGKWNMHNTKLKKRLSNNHEWIEFESSDENFGPILNGIGNMDIYKSSFNQLSKKPFEGLTVRLFNPETKLWSLYWVDGNTGVMDPPVVGSFEGNIGKFFCKDIFDGKPILVVFVWDKTDKDNPVWSQAFSADNGHTWEWNFTNVSHRIK
jgi:hypothetical protein